MFSVRRRGVARLAAATVVSGLVAAGAIAVAGPALAEGGADGTGGATATLGKLTVFDTVKIKGQGKVSAGLFEMQVTPGGVLQTYCIDLYTGAKTGQEYKEVGWDQSSLHNNENAGKIRWILQNSYPQVDKLDELAAKVGAKNLTKETAAAATQAAIWYFSDNVEAEPVNKDAQKLTAFLEKEAVNLEEPKASLSLSPASVAGKSGERLGPITVDTNTGSAAVSLTPGAPEGVKLVDKDGKVVTNVAKGGQVFFDVPAGTPDGAAELQVQADTTVPIGRAFVSTKVKSQTLILAGTSTSSVNAKATATWAKKGAIPAVTVEKNCAKGGLDVTASNEGDEDFTFEVKGQKVTIPGGQSKTVTVPLAEDEAYDFTITGPNFEKNFKGVLDCKTATPGPLPSETPSTEPSVSTSPTPGTAGGSSTGSTTGGGDLAETGGSSATPMIAGIAAVLVVLGGGAVFFLRKKKTAGQ
ncbi:Cys-Gln thioester bond-forming surface protein [Streptomyces sp. P9(2023)]|uniref:Cys-Gln thioester bond-forming surface protein n=1 Tax=Streptomyces sp. P9(2023) TaxID=3064394 RepID=UPI0028F4479D|nr:Cys-Gln thioester bond-forming surface protein [Streptomyces sp. P9(2023)]MDT9690282.1 Cys-Gln thioester bond-forming surface protein [Streptomyces sp. P9(2023)]